ncbi:STAS domain-containing protein [Myceligenerans sp. TRM 65318]|uniref:STAS domain-containing protein n=1 Tax=Myceligenerans pegani TaxID=2776917 RepID=A0ABR9MZB8_9MICO|nr:STAS domain-containing protein [Myceligenerans sp. TRM 65318]MBE3018474.1 STAS domain-containing protein [Myceligenerans sp. TRM 65318]
MSVRLRHAREQGREQVKDLNQLSTAGSILVEEKTEATVVKMSGEIDISLRSQTGAALRQVLDRSRPVVVDTSGVTFMDSTGAAFLAQLRMFGSEDGIRVSLAEQSTVVRNLLEMLGVDAMFRDTPMRPAAAGTGHAI